MFFFFRGGGGIILTYDIAIIEENVLFKVWNIPFNLNVLIDIITFWLQLSTVDKFILL